MTCPEIVVLSPSRFSLYTLCVVEQLAAAGFRIRGICIRTLMNPARLREEYLRGGRRLLARIRDKILFRGSAFQAAPGESIAAYKRKLGLSEQTVPQLARRRGIPILSCRTLNDTRVIQFLETVRPSLVVFTGGGILRKPVLERAGLGAVNCHMGILPCYRGMDVAQWAVLERRPEMLGITVHLMGEGIDTGDILTVRPVPLRSGDKTFHQHLARYEPLMCEEIVDASRRFVRGDLAPRRQHRKEGKQYFTMHPALHGIAESLLRKQTEATGTEQSKVPGRVEQKPETLSIDRSKENPVRGEIQCGR